MARFRERHWRVYGRSRKNFSPYRSAQFIDQGTAVGHGGSWAEQRLGGRRSAPWTYRRSRRWVEGYERQAELAGKLPRSRIVYVADREGDMLELMQTAYALGYPANSLLRAQHNRCLPQGGKLRWNGNGAEIAKMLAIYKHLRQDAGTSQTTRKETTIESEKVGI